MLDVLRAIVAEALRALGRDGLVRGAGGSVAVAERTGGVVLVTGEGLLAAEAAPDGVAEVDLATGVHRSGPAPSLLLPLHLALLAAGHGAVVAVGAPHAAAVGLVEDEIPPVLADQGARAGGPTPVVEWDGADPLRAAQPLLAALGGDVATAVLRHGPLVAVAGDVAGARDAALAADEAAQVYLLARSVGRPRTLL